MTTVHPTAVVNPGAELGDGVNIGPYCVVGPDVRLGHGTRLHAHVVMEGHVTVGEQCTVFPFASIGTQTQDLKYRGATTYVEIGDRTTVREYVTVNSGTTEGDVTHVGSGCLLMAYAHVAHSCSVGNEVIMANCATLGGHIEIQDQAILGGLSAVHQFVRVGRLCIVGGCTKVTQDCPPFMTVDGHPARAHGINRVGLQRRGVNVETRTALRRAYRVLYREGLSVPNAVQRLRADMGERAEIVELLAFIEGSRRGIVGGHGAGRSRKNATAG